MRTGGAPGTSGSIPNAAEFSTDTAYMAILTYEDECEANPTNNKKIMVLGGGPNRIGQGIEFRLLLCSCRHGDA